MKRKIIIVSVIILIVGVTGLILLTRSKALGGINHSFSEPTTSTSNITFHSEAGDRIKFSFRSDIENGELDIYLYDSTGNEVYRLDKAKALETYFDLGSSDIYTLAADYNNFVGRFKIKIYEAD